MLIFFKLSRGVKGYLKHLVWRYRLYKVVLFCAPGALRTLGASVLGVSFDGHNSG